MGVHIHAAESRPNVGWTVRGPTARGPTVIRLIKHEKCPFGTSLELSINNLVA